MTKKIYRRLLLAAVMLLMATALTYTGPVRPVAAVEQTCGECIDDCDAWYANCVASGRTGCLRGRFICVQSCGPVCNAQ
jgi:hypothetical protein